MERAALPAAGFDALDELDEVALAVPRDFAPSAEFVLAPAWAGLGGPGHRRCRGGAESHRAGIRRPCGARRLGARVARVAGAFLHLRGIGLKQKRLIRY